jgi:2-polyprenyl-3-methyl-5-hydroxy-6-metoxy-1,4-benzoquinol methylase
MFSKRSYQAEIMDDFAISGEIMQKTIQEIDFINRWLGGNAITLKGISELYKPLSHNFSSQNPLQVVDLGCGSGEMLTLLAQWAKKRNIPAIFTGIDANDYIITLAQQNTTQYSEIFYKNLNVFSEKFASENYDIATATLFCHHFTDEELIRLLTQLKNQVKVGIVINDLHRHWFAYYSIKMLTSWFSKSYLVKNDAKLSVLRAFRKKELENILHLSGIKKYKIRWGWAFRWKVIIYCNT